MSAFGCFGTAPSQSPAFAAVQFTTFRGGELVATLLLVAVVGLFGHFSTAQLAGVCRATEIQACELLLLLRLLLLPWTQIPVLVVVSLRRRPYWCLLWGRTCGLPGVNIVGPPLGELLLPLGSLLPLCLWLLPLKLLPLKLLPLKLLYLLLLPPC